MSKTLLFTDDFKKLIPYGFKFGKYWARNYIGYSYSMPGQTRSELMIWRAGRDVECEQFRLKFDVDLLTDFYQKCVSGYEWKYEERLFGPPRCKIMFSDGALVPTQFPDLSGLSKPDKEKVWRSWVDEHPRMELTQDYIGRMTHLFKSFRFEVT